ncbi:hypothetical protein AWM70_10340 [Paenibacillus yonginensis]|uniref:DUF2207 domain-containing protein n=1 Tax=Paenibacillus yonginensis TaxID=1462996 RepID=A0A1B1N0K8_9BACL|nr:hypothetical protein [Paenibacillus yonginensis]ANS74949.1 hypothetical protein AWM70_10340 [Paenibacillus yonginensis]
MRRQNLIFWIVMALVAVGVIRGLLSNWISLVIPLVLVALVYVLYKYPPKRFRRGPKIKPSARTAAKVAASQRRSAASSRSSSEGKRKHYPFQVIDGQKGKNDEDLPKYH